MAVDDVLVAYSDGVTDAESPAGQPFGEDRLERVLASCRHESARAIAEAVLSAVGNHVGGAPAMDDMTVMVLKRRE